jgi:hypothetical protein
LDETSNDMSEKKAMDKDFQETLFHSPGRESLSSNTSTPSSGPQFQGNSDVSSLILFQSGASSISSPTLQHGMLRDEKHSPMTHLAYQKEEDSSRRSPSYRDYIPRSRSRSRERRPYQLQHSLSRPKRRLVLFKHLSKIPFLL